MLKRMRMRTIHIPWKWTTMIQAKGQEEDAKMNGDPKFKATGGSKGTEAASSKGTKGVSVYNFLSFFSLAFGRSKNWMAPKVRAGSTFS
jgi:hypothetical protein